jgi:hypothetical protein
MALAWGYLGGAQEGEKAASGLPWLFYGLRKRSHCVSLCRRSAEVLRIRKSTPEMRRVWRRTYEVRVWEEAVIVRAH